MNGIKRTRAQIVFSNGNCKNV